MAFDCQMYVYGFFKSSEGRKISNEVCYPIYVYEFLIDNFVDGEEIFESIDDMEENYQKIQESALLELIDYLLFSNDFVHNCRSDTESELFEESIKAYNSRLDDKQIKDLRECYDFKLTKATLLSATFEM